MGKYSEKDRKVVVSLEIYTGVCICTYICHAVWCAVMQSNKVSSHPMSCHIRSCIYNMDISIIILYHHKLLRESTSCCSRTSCSSPRPSLVSLCRACGRTCGGWLVPPWLFRSSYWASFVVDPPPQVVNPRSGSCSGCWWLCAVPVCLPASSSKLTWYFCGFLWSGLFWFSCFIYTHTHVYVETTELGWSHHICRHWCPDSKPRLKQYKSWDFNPVWWLSWLNQPPVSDLDKRPWDLLTHLLGPYEFQDA